MTRGPPWAGNTLSAAEHLLSAHRRCACRSGGTMCRRIPPPEDTIGIPHAQTSRPGRRMDPASVTQLAIHICPSTTHPGDQRTVPRGRTSSCRVSLWCAPPLSAKRRFACRSRRNQRSAGPVGWSQRRCDRGGGDRARTDDLLLAKQALSQLSYTPFSVIRDQGSVIRTAAAGLQPRHPADGAAAIGSDY